MLLNLSVVFLAVIFIYPKPECNAVKGELNITLSKEEIQAINQLRPLVKDYLYKDYMQEDYYMVRYLRAKKLNVEAAKDMLLKSLIWRKQHKMDSILEETMKVEKFYPYIVTLGRDGRRVGIVRVGDFQVRKNLVAGRYSELVRLVYKIAEIAMREIRESADVAGKNITQGHLIGDLSGYNHREHACLLCIRMYTDLIGKYEKYYPQLANTVIAVNTPRIFESAWSIVKPLLSDYTRSSVTIYGYDKNEWRRALLEIVSNDKLPRFLGGTFDQRHI